MNIEEERKAFNEQFGIDDANTFPAFGDGIDSSAVLKCNWLGWVRCAEQKQAEIKSLKSELAKAQAVPEGFVLVKKVHPDAIVHNQGLSLFKECQVIYGWNGKSKDFKNALNRGFYHGVKLGAKAVLGSEIEAQEQSNV